MAIKKIAAAIGKWFLKEPPPPLEKKPQPRAALNTHIRSILKSKKQATASKLQLINLEKIRELFPEGSDGFAQNVSAVLRSVILRRLGPGDAFTETGSDSYIIVFESLNQQDAELQCVLIVQEVLRTLFDDRRLDDKVDIRTVTVGIDGKVDAAEVDLLDIIERLMNGKPVPRSISSGGRAQDAATSAGAQSSQHAGREAEMLALSQAAKSLSPDLKFIYRPFWDVTRKVISTYVCTVSDGKTEGYAVLGHEPDLLLVPAVDFLVFGSILHKLRKLHEENKRLLISCPVHIDTLCSPKSWPTYKTLCDRLTATLSNHDVVFEICGIDARTDPAMLDMAMRKLVDYCHHIVLRTSHVVPPLAFAEDCKPRYLFTDLAAFPGSEKRKMKLMDEYVTAAQALGTGAMISSLNLLREVTAAVGSGFTCIGGDAVHPVIDKPDYIFRFEAKDLLDFMSPAPKADAP